MMLKTLRKSIVVSLCAVIVSGTSIISNADSSTDNQIEPRVKYDYSASFGYGIYLGGGIGRIFKNAYNPYYLANQYPAVSGKPIGIIYRILNKDGKVVGAKQLSNPQKGYKVSFKYEGDVKGYLRNVYSEAYVQKANGSFIY